MILLRFYHSTIISDLAPSVKHYAHCLGIDQMHRPTQQRKSRGTIWHISFPGFAHFFSNSYRNACSFGKSSCSSTDHGCYLWYSLEGTSPRPWHIYHLTIQTQDPIYLSINKEAESEGRTGRKKYATCGRLAPLTNEPTEKHPCKGEEKKSCRRNDIRDFRRMRARSIQLFKRRRIAACRSGIPNICYLVGRQTDNNGFRNEPHL